MKFLIATDLHGSAYWAQKVVEKYKQVKADALILLGDVYNHGPRNPFPQDYAPMEVASILSEVNNLVAIKGNCDSEVDQMISNFQFVEDNALFVGGVKAFLTHGHVYNKDALPCLNKGDLLFYGHTHISEIVESGGVICVNVGSPSLPKDNKRPYCILDETSVAIYDFDDKVIASRKIK